MARIDGLLELLNTLILSTDDNVVTTDKEIIQSILTCLQVSQAKVEVFQTQTWLLQDELEKNNLQHFELAFVENNPLFKEEEEMMIKINN
jgi:hypothetical protein